MAANRQCSAIKADSQRCQGVAIDETGLCYAHHPDHAQDRHRNASMGGRRGGRGRPNALIADLRRQLLEIAEAVKEDEIEESRAAVIARILRLAIQSVSEEVAVREKVELIPRLEEVEEMLAARQQDKWGRRWGS